MATALRRTGGTASTRTRVHERVSERASERRKHAFGGRARTKEKERQRERGTNMSRRGIRAQESLRDSCIFVYILDSLSMRRKREGRGNIRERETDPLVKSGEAQRNEETKEKGCVYACVHRA